MSGSQAFDWYDDRQAFSENFDSSFDREIVMR
jgi:hypothetical protein